MTDPTAGPSHSLKYGELSARSDDYDPPTWEKCDLFYRGGFALEKRVADYMPKLVGEHPKRYAERIKSAAYLNYVGQIVDYFTSALFADELTVREPPQEDGKPARGAVDDDYYASFAKDADGRGTKLNDILKVVLTNALNKRRALLHLDMPASSGDAANLAQEEAMGLGRLYAFEVPLEQVIDWDYDDQGGFSYVVIHRKKTTKGAPGKRAGTIVEEFKVWEKVEAHEPEGERLGFDPDSNGDAGSVVRWSLYRVEYRPEDCGSKQGFGKDGPAPEFDVPLVDEGTVSFKRIPLLEFVVPDGLWVGNKLVPVAQEHYARRASLNAGENRSMVAIPYVALGPEMSAVGDAMPSQAQQNPNRGVDPVSKFEAQGWLQIGAGDSIGFAEPEGKAYDLVDQQLTRLKDEMFRIVHQMAMSVSNNAKGVGRSGESKKEDRYAEGIVLGEYGRLLRNFAVLVHKTASDARGETDADWQAYGLDDFTDEMREDMIAEAVALQPIAAGIPSLTFKKRHAVQLARRLVKGASPEDLDTIETEVEAGVEEDEQMAKDAKAAAHQSALLGPVALQQQIANGGKPAPGAFGAKE